MARLSQKEMRQSDRGAGVELLKQTFGRDAETARRDGETTRRDGETRRQEFMFSGSLSLPEKVPSFAV